MPAKQTKGSQDQRANEHRRGGVYLKWMTSTYVLYTDRTTLCFGLTRFGTARKIPVTSTLRGKGEGAHVGNPGGASQRHGNDCSDGLSSPQVHIRIVLKPNWTHVDL